jgi:hypothetical protein
MSYGAFTMTQNGLASTSPDLTTLLWLVLATAGLASFLRALPWPKSWLLVKPLACPVCMSGWSGFAVLGLAAFDAQTTGWGPAAYVLTWLFCVGGAALAFRQLYPPEFELPLP